MRLKRLELSGFKSFADRTVLDFRHSLVGIVGPNGCGKSNVVDAVRWVLGEQRPSSMRGGEMADVIFKGSASRPALSVAEVTMVLDNGKGVIEGRGEEIGITRRVYKSGEGEYQIDGERVRLKDVREMLYGTGLGSRGYAFLEQGKIDAVLSANPLERRAIFEEAAGISRYRQRIKEAESRLRRVEADLVRLDDILGELARRERSLKVQAGRAQRYLEAKEEWTREGLRWSRHRVHRLRDEAAAVRRALAALEEEAGGRREARAAAERDVARLAEDQAQLGAVVDRLAAEASELAGDLRALEERGGQLGARVEAWRETAAEEGARAAELERKLEERSAEQAGLRRELDELGGACHEAEDEAGRLDGRQAELARELDEARVVLESANARALELFQEHTSWRNRVQHLAEALGPQGERLQAAERRCAETEEAARDARAAAVDAAAELERLRSSVARRDEQREALEAELRARTQEARHLDERRAGLELERARLASRIESLCDWERERENLERGARDVLAGIASEDGPVLAGEVRGLLADHLRVDTEHARALDAALEGRAEALVLSHPEDAAVILAWLKRGEAGRATLVSGTGLARADAPRARADAELLDADGVEGRLVERLRPHAGFERLAELVVGDVVVARDLEAAFGLVERRPDLRFVTREGDLVQAAGVRGGHVEVVHGPIGRRSTAAELEVEREALSAELGTLAGDLSRARRAEEDVEGRLAELRELLEREGRALERAESEAEAARARAAELEHAVEVLAREREHVAGERTAMEAELEGARQREREREQDYAAERARMDGLEERRAALEAERERIASEASGARSEARGRRERLDALARRADDLARSCVETRAELERARRLAREAGERADAGEEERAGLVGEREALFERRASAEERLASAREDERAGRASIEGLRRSGESLTEELEGLSARVTEKRLEEQRLALALEEAGRRAEEDFGVPPGRLLEDFEPEAELDEAALARLGQRVAELRRDMEKCGPVNTEAVDELSEVSERLGFLQSQRGDLETARRSLESTVAKLNAESERRFVETFEEVRDGFRTIFRQLFGGGAADVQLLEGAPVLEAGIEILARPPGRESLPISLLSGGQRSMTALALLFAVFRSRPSPFCILDEVDAALDDANIGRFLGLLEHSVDDTQFVVVTHNKGTMAACQVLYGVTMEVRGVSRVVSVELEDVEEFVPEATGGGAGSANGGPAAAGGGGDVPPAASGNGGSAPAGQDGAEESPAEAEVDGGAGEGTQAEDADDGVPAREGPREPDGEGEADFRLVPFRRDVEPATR